MNNEPLLSIIIPVYNVAPYIRKCIESVLRQNTCVVYDVILVNDGSTDGSLEICQEYSSRDSRIKLISKENGGVSSARNAGLDIAKGKWIWFVDADDWISVDSLEIISRSLNLNNTDFLCFSIEYRNTQGGFLGRDLRTQRSGNINDVIESIDYAPPSVIMKRAVIDSCNIRFTEGVRMFEDLEFQYKVLMLCQTAAFIPDTLYYVLRHDGSAVANQNSLNNAAEDIPTALENIVGFIKKHGIKESPWLSSRINRAFKSCISMNSLIESPNTKRVQKVLRNADNGLFAIGFRRYRDYAVVLGCIDVRISFLLLKLKRLLHK